jgi:nucleoside-triphosphatase THEP1
MPIATVVGGSDPEIHALFTAAIAKWRAAGLKVVGLVAETHGLPDRTCRAGFLRDVVSGKTFSIFLETPPSHTSCHLDAAGVETACQEILKQIPESDLVVLSKFGKLEADRGGLARAFDAAIAAGKPVLTTVSEKHRDAWRDFAADAIDLPPEQTALDQWRNAINSERTAATLRG